MMESKAVIGETDMLQNMQQAALHLAGKALELFDVTEATEIARFIKKEFDRLHGAGWQCIVGTHFGSFVTHHSGCFIYFNIGSLAILLFKDTSDRQVNKSHFISMDSKKAGDNELDIAFCKGGEQISLDLERGLPQECESFLTV